MNVVTDRELTLWTLGRSELCPARQGGAIPLAPKRLALVSYLTLARPRGFHRRDLLFVLFWPELDAPHARNALNQALHGARAVLGDGAVVSRGRDEVGLADGALSCDALAFEGALREERWADALAAYGGELLLGLYATGADGFERWLDGERTRLRRLARDAASHLAEAETRAENHRAAARWLERGLEIVPTDETLLRRLMAALHAAGDRAGALAAFERFARFLRSEYDAEPASETMAMVETARSGALEAPRRASPPAALRRDIRSLAVLPLRDLSGDAAHSAFADGMTGALITELGRIRSLRVISQQSVMGYRGSHRRLRDIARQLDVQALIEGSVLRTGERVRITAQFVAADPETHLWSDAFERDARDVIAVHRDVARAVSGAVFAVLTAEEERELVGHPPVIPDAYDAYLAGWHKHSTISPSELPAAVGLYQEAIARDPSFAPPWAGLGLVHFLLLSMGELPLDAGLRGMQEAIDRALALDPTFTPGQVAQGQACTIVHDWRRADELLHRATVTAPNLSLGHASLAAYLVGVARFDDAIAAAERARRLDPLAPYVNFLEGWCLHYADRPDDAVQRLRVTLDLFPDYPLPWVFLAKSYYQLHQREAAAEACRRSLDLLGTNPMTLAYVIHVLAGIGARDHAERAMARFDEQGRARGFVAPYYAAIALCGLGKRDEALTQLDTIGSGASTTGWLLAVDPLLDPLRGDARFEAVQRRIGLTFSR